MAVRPAERVGNWRASGPFRTISTIIGLLGAMSMLHAREAAGASEPGGVQASRSLTGTITDAVGGTVSGADVRVTCGPVSRSATSAADGTFAIADLPDARCDVQVESQSFEPKRLLIDLARENARLVVTLDLRGLRTFVAVTASRSVEESAARIPAHTTVTGADDIRVRAYQVLPQALAEEPGIVVQQTSTAQGAPIIRGLIGYQTVAMIDGIRLNTSAWRAGPVQYLAWYHASLVDRIEVMRGPGSVLYGSDALGGTVRLRGIQPSFSADGLRVHGAANLAASSADSGGGASARVEVSGARAGLLAGGGYDHFNDVRPGKGIDSHAAVTRFLGLPSDVLESNRMRETGYDQRFGHLAGAVGLGSSTRIDGSYHYNEQTGVSRYDRKFGGDGLFRSELGPQRLDVGLLKIERGRTAFLDAINASLSINRQADGRLEQARPIANVDAQQNTTKSFGYQLQGVRGMGRHDLTAGVEMYDDYLSGFRTITSPAGVSSVARPDVPDGTRYTSLGAFGQDVMEVVPERLSVRGGLRYSKFDFRTSAQPALGVVDESVASDAVTFQAGGVLNVTRTFSLSASGGRGFRAPNASDLGMIGVTSVFEVAPSRAMALGGLMGTTDGATATSTGRPLESLRPEHLYSFEAGVRYQGRSVTASAAGYMTEMRDAIQRRTIIFANDITGTTIAGFDVVRQDVAGRAFIATNPSPMVTRVNVAKARLRGVEAEARVRISADWLTSTYFSYGRGTDLDAHQPLRRVPPGVGGARLRWQPASRPFWLEAVGTFMTRYDRMAPGDLTDARMGAPRTTQSITAYFNGTATDLGLVRNGILVQTGETLAQVQERVLGGASASPLFSEMPGYVVLAARGSYRVTPHMELILVADNLADVNYRHLGSGVDAQGRSVRVHTSITF